MPSQNIQKPSPLALAEMLFHLTFPKKDFNDLSDTVKIAYRKDADRLLEMLKVVAEEL